MKKSPNSPTVNLGQLQLDLEMSTNNLKLAERAKLRADQAYEEALALHDKQRVAFNGAFQTVKASTVVTNLYAK